MAGQLEGYPSGRFRFPLALLMLPFHFPVPFAHVIESETERQQPGEKHRASDRCLAGKFRLWVELLAFRRGAKHSPGLPRLPVGTGCSAVVGRLTQARIQR